MSVMVRFSEHLRYDINRDGDVVLMMATTDHGSYWMEAPAAGPVGMRQLRQDFKDGVVDCINKGQPPCELEYNEEGYERTLGQEHG